MRFSERRALIAGVVLSTLFAGIANAQRVADVRGIHFGAALNGTSVKLDETAVTDDEREGGIGATLSGGYNFNRNFGVILGLSGVSIDDEGTENFEVGHFDLGARASFPGRSAFVPYVELALTLLSAQFDVQVQGQRREVEMKGGGVTAAAGFNYFFSRIIAFDANLRLTGGKFSDIEIDDRDADLVEDIDVTTARLNLGIAIYP